MNEVMTSDPTQWRLLGNLYEVLPIAVASVAVVLAAVLAGFIVGVEREYKRKPAGLRTLALVSAGSCLFTLASRLMASDMADPSRIAASVATGVGFLGAGVIIRDRGAVSGLTTGTIIWTTAALGILAGAGFAATAIAMSLMLVAVLLGIGLLEERLRKRCRFVPCRIHYKRDRGKARVQLLKVLDHFGIPDADWKVTVQEDADSEEIELHYCHYHAEHRAVLYEVAAIPAVREIERKRSARATHRDAAILADVGTHTL